MFICCFTIRVMILFIRMMKTPVGVMGDCLYSNDKNFALLLTIKTIQYE